MQQPLGSGFGRHTPASEVLKGVDLSGKRVVVTGGYSGIGTETTRALAAAGAKVFVPARNLAKARPVMDLDGDIQVANMDLENHASIERFAMDVASEGPLDILINNAGIMACPERRIGPGWESQFGTNHLGHMALTKALLPSLLAAEAPRVVCLSSTAHQITDIRWEDPHFESEPYEKWKAYGQSKTANALFAVALQQHHGKDGLLAFAVHPGGIQTPLQRHLATEEMVAMGWIDADGNLSEQAKGMFKSVEAGASTTCWAATSPQLADHGGAYCEDADIAALAQEGDRFRGVKPYAVDPEGAARLWDLSEAMLR
jgi:NAD(P)-dependent dehydrogenase (short-subunit alcohol dehydrogenase family)